MNPEPETNTCQVTKEPRLKAFWRWVLQAYWKHTELTPPEKVQLIVGQVIQERGQPPRINKPAVFAKDAIFVRSEIKLSFKDIARCLLGCRLQVHSTTYCETPPGAVHTEVVVFAVL